MKTQLARSVWETTRGKYYVYRGGREIRTERVGYRLGFESIRGRSSTDSPSLVCIHNHSQFFQIVQWTADDRLRDLEENMYNQGFVPNAKGF